MRLCIMIYERKYKYTNTNSNKELWDNLACYAIILFCYQ